MAAIEKMDLTSLDIRQEQLQKLKALFPEVFTEHNQIDWERLRLSLGDDTVDVGKERYGMNWPGKADCFKTIQQPSIATLIPVQEESIDFDTTKNLFIEGDNLEVLKLLQKSYLGKIKMIYIDPPYNTGNDFIYPDNYSENLDTYLEYTGQLDSEGKKFATNTETDGRYHSKWMNMIYPRLFLARNLLQDDGAAFVSIDDNELDNLKKICNEIFGENNFVGQITVINNLKGRNDKKNIAQAHEYLLIYQKNNFTSAGLPLTAEQLKAFKHIDENGEKYTLRDLRKRGSGDRKEDRENMHFPIYYNMWEKRLSLERIDPNDVEILPKRGDLSDGRWRWGPDTVASNLKILQPRYSKLKKRWDVDYRIYLNPNITDELPEEEIIESNVDPLSDNSEEDTEDYARTSKSKSFWTGGEISSDVGKRNFKELFENKADFPYPKSLEFLKRCLNMGMGKQDIVLDFFAGSCGIAQSVFEMNINDKGNRKFICVQLPEILDESKVKSKEDKAVVAKNISFLNSLGKKLTVAELGKQRIVRAIQKVQTKRSLDKEKITDETIMDLGFKVFKLSASNFKMWDSTLEKDPELIQQKLFEHVDHISPEAQQEAILYELLLKSGFPLNISIETLTLAGKSVFSIAGGQLLICLERELTHECIQAMAEKQPSRVICLDEAFIGINADALKTNAVQIMKTNGVINFRTV